MASKSKINRIRRNRIRNKVRATLKIKEMFLEALIAYREDYDYANDIIRKAVRLKLKNQARLEMPEKLMLCKNCKSLLIPGYNCRVRLKAGHLVYFCARCKHMRRIPYKRRV